MWIAIIAFIILLVVLVVAHEFGHFILSKRAGVRVYEFAVGMWPKLFSRNKPQKLPRLPKESQHLIWPAREEALEEVRQKENKKTEFSFRLFPIGGFVSIKGESPSQEWATSDKDSLLKAPFRWKIAILLGWITMNVIVALILFTVGFSKGTQPIQVLPDNMLNTLSRSYLMPSYSFLEEQWLLSWSTEVQPAKVLSVGENTIASSIGLQEGDDLIAVANVPITNMNIQTELRKHVGQQFELQYIRGEEEKIVTVSCPQDSCMLGVALDTTSTVEVKPIKFPLWWAIKAAFHEVREQTRLTFIVLGNIFSSIWEKDGGGVANKLSWPIAAAKIGQMVLEDGWWILFLMFGWMLSMALAVFNVLPIPALDGWRIFGMSIQKIFRLNSEKYYTVEGWINTFFFVLLMILAAYLMLHDLVVAWWVKIPFIG